jgi:NTP pyrophosphatase (non-canonical NTP hydrolase)
MSIQAITYDCGELEELRKKVGEWAARNFGSTLPENDRVVYGMLRCAAGMSEELSELIESNDQTTPCPKDMNEAKDAIADICIYALDFCYTAEIQMQEMLLNDREPSRWEKEFLKLNVEGVESIIVVHVGLAVVLGKIQHSVLKMSQGIRLQENHMDQIVTHMCHVWRLCYRLADFWRSNLNELVKTTAEKVIQRDWIANPDDAHERV